MRGELARLLVEYPRTVVFVTHDIEEAAQLADRIANDVDSVVLAFNFRGCRPSGGRFSMAGWLNDVRAAVDHLFALLDDAMAKKRTVAPAPAAATTSAAPVAAPVSQTVAASAAQR